METKMPTIPLQIGNLNQVDLLLEAGTRADRMDLTEEPEAFGFVFGLGVEGMSPFEVRLLDHRVGDEVTLEVRRAEIGRIFEHIHPPLLQRLQGHDAFYLKARVEQVRAANNREVVRAMASQHACGSDCDCGCGCE
jgi:hypothetical protein